ncbi:MAG TPA: MFS transporter [Verrucomicrobiae bacterium]|nr:MFS transporter [Verrucomicrobiae bacterium]
MTTATPEAKARVSTQTGLARFLGKFTVLKGAIRELWLVFIVKFLGIAAYALTNSTLVLWLSSDFGYSDEQSLALVAAWSALMTLFTLLVGSLTDVLGLRKTFFIGVWICILARTVMVFASAPWLALGGGLLPLAFGEALGTPVMIAATQRYSSTRQRSISFSIVYTMMNVGFLLAAYIFDDLRRDLGEYRGASLFGLHLSTYRTLFLVSLLLEFSLLPFLYFLRAGAVATDQGLALPSAVAPQPPLSLWSAFRRTLRQSVTETLQLLGRLFRQAGFYRLLAFLVLIAFIKLIYKQMDYVYPKFGIRELGEGAPIGRLWAINNYLVIFLVPLVGALTQRFSAYRMVIIGGSISAASVFIMALPAPWFVPLANGGLGDWLGHWYLGLTGVVHPYYVMIALFVVLLSLGEAFYSPRVYEYAAAIAPKGQEASYGALSYVPFLLAKLMVGSFGGVLLAKYCPETGPRHPATLWLILGLTTLVAPAGLLVFRRFIRVHEVGRED